MHVCTHVCVFITIIHYYSLIPPVFRTLEHVLNKVLYIALFYYYTSILNNDMQIRWF